MTWNIPLLRFSHQHPFINKFLVFFFFFLLKKILRKKFQFHAWLSYCISLSLSLVSSFQWWQFVSNRWIIGWEKRSRKDHYLARATKLFRGLWLIIATWCFRTVDWKVKKSLRFSSPSRNSRKDATLRHRHRECVNFAFVKLLTASLLLCCLQACARFIDPVLCEGNSHIYVCTLSLVSIWTLCLIYSNWYVYVCEAYSHSQKFYAHIRRCLNARTWQYRD